VVVDVIPSNIEEERLNWDRLDLGRIINHVIQIYAFRWVLSKSIYQRDPDLRRRRFCLLSYIVDLDNGTTPLQLPLEEVVEELDICLANLNT
jgi:hypothetical protein